VSEWVERAGLARKLCRVPARARERRWDLPRRGRLAYVSGVHMTTLTG
jgi:hypothetical protein